jgi:MFS family permease
VTAPPEQLGVLGLLRVRRYRLLLELRFATQWGDGMFQAALGGAVLFNPERQADPLAVALGLAVLLMPYSIIGPFVGTLLDRWDRRRVLIVANAARVGLVAVVAVAVVSGMAGPVLYLGALAVMGFSRFVLAGLSVALPHVVERRYLVEANTLAVTAGAGVSALGAVCAIGLRLLVGSGNTGSAVTTLVAAVGPLVAALLAPRFARRSLGPDTVGGASSTGMAVLRGFVDGGRAVAANPSIAASFAGLAAHRLAFGISTLLTLLLYRYAFTDTGPLRAGLPGIGEVVAVAAAGLLCAAIAAPWLVHRWGRAWTIRVALSVACVTQLGLGLLLSIQTVIVGAFVIGLSGQVVKLCADAAVQGDGPDGLLGRIFALYDVVFNVGYVGAVALAAFAAPPDGRAPWLFAGASALYAVGLLVHNMQARRTRPAVTPRPALPPTVEAAPPLPQG